MPSRKRKDRSKHRKPKRKDRKMDGASLNCPLCSKKDEKNEFSNSAALIFHYYEFHNARYCCQYCSRQFVDQKDRERHVGIQHVTRASYKCGICGRTQRQKKCLKQHQKEEHATLNELTCSCGIVLPNKDSYYMHAQFCYENSDQSKETKGDHQLRPNGPISDTPHACPYVCPYCPARFENRYAHCQHLIDVHAAGVMCGYCHNQFSAPRGDEEAALRVFKEHLERDHKAAKFWSCIYCNTVFTFRQDLINHQESVQHHIHSCHVCSALMPSRDVQILHREFQHNAPQLSCNDRLELFCPVCFRRYPRGNFFDHLRGHFVDRMNIYCNECFKLSKNLQNHKGCLEREAMRFQTVSTRKGAESSSHVCFCGFCAIDTDHLKRHINWCHKDRNRRDCAKEVNGVIDIKSRECSGPIGPTATPAFKSVSDNVESELSRLSSVEQGDETHEAHFQHEKQSLETQRSSSCRSRSKSFNEGCIAWDQPPRAVENTPSHEPPSPEKDAQRPQKGITPTTFSLPKDACAIKEEPLTPVKPRKQKQKLVEDVEQSNNRQAQEKKPTKVQHSDVTSSSSNNVGDANDTVETAQKKSRKKRSLETGEPGEKADAPIPKKRSKPTSSESAAADESSSTTSTSSKECRHVHKAKTATAKGEKRRGQKELGRFFESSADSSASSDEGSGEGASKATSLSKDKSTINSSIADKRASTSSIAVTPVRMNVFLAAASSARAQPPTKRTAMEYYCSLCSQKSPYRQNILRHVGTIHRIATELCAKFCEAREIQIPEPVPILQEPNGNSNRGSAACSGKVSADASVTADLPCAGCLHWQRKLHALEKFLADVTKKVEKTKKALERNE